MVTQKVVEEIFNDLRYTRSDLRPCKRKSAKIEKYTLDGEKITDK